MTSKTFQPEVLAMFAHLPLLPRRFGISRFWAFWLGAATGFTLVCLLSGGQPQAFTPPPEQDSRMEQLFPQTFIHAPEVGFISEVQASGPSLRAIAAAWPIEAMSAAR